MLARWLGGLVAVLALLWAGWWVVGSRLHTAALEGWLADRRAAGWVAEAEPFATTGFPNRFDTRIETLRLANPAAGWAWETSFLDILMLAWQPNAAVVALPPGQVVAVPGARARIDATPLRASIRFGPAISLPLEAFSAEAGAVRVVGDAGWQAEAETLAVHLRRLAAGSGPENSYAAFAEARAVRLPDPLRVLVDPAGVLAPVADSLLFDARAALDGPLDRRAVEMVPPGIVQLRLERLALRWGTLALEASGMLAADAQGLAEGQLDLRAENWRALLEAFVDSGLVNREIAGALEFALGFLERPRDGRSVIEVPLTMAGGAARIGPVTIGAAPRLRRATGAP